MTGYRQERIMFLMSQFKKSIINSSEELLEKLETLMKEAEYMSQKGYSTGELTVSDLDIIRSCLIHLLAQVE
jgi:hypothetical protein